MSGYMMLLVFWSYKGLQYFIVLASSERSNRNNLIFQQTKRVKKNGDNEVYNVEEAS